MPNGTKTRTRPSLLAAARACDLIDAQLGRPEFTSGDRLREEARTAPVRIDLDTDGSDLLVFEVSL